MVRTFVLLAVMLLAFGAATLAATQDEGGPGDPLLGERLVEGAATSEFLWVRNSTGAVVEFRRSNGARRELAVHGVLDMLRSDDRLLGLRAVGGVSGAYQVFDLTAQTPASPKLTLDKPPFALLAGGDLVILARDALFRLEGNMWLRRNLTEPLRGGPQMSLSSNRAGMIYVGYNHGEWGGGMQVIELATGRVSEVRRIDGSVCEGPLGQECDPVTGLARDATRPECVLASVGLLHLSLAHGRILRVCGAEVEVVFSERAPLLSGPGSWPSSTWPFFSLSPTRDGWVAVSFGRLFHSSNGVVSQSEMLSYEHWRGLELAFAHPDLIILRTDLNWANSTSGYTPLLVPVTE